MGDKPEIVDKESFEAWLNSHDEDTTEAYGKVMAGRVALRVLPNLGQIWAVDEPTKIKSDLTLHSLRANLISAVARKYPTAEMKNAAASAARSAAASVAYSVADSAADSAAASAARSAAASVAYSVADSAADSAAASAAFSAAASAALSSDSAARSALSSLSADDIWASIQADAMALHGGMAVEALEQRPIWLGAAPDWFVPARNDLRRALQQDGPHWGFWLDWFAAKAAGEPMERLGVAGEDFIGKKLAEQDDAFWDEGAEAVGAAIEDWIGEWEALQLAKLQSNQELEDADLDSQKPAAFQFYLNDGKVDALPIDNSDVTTALADDFLFESKRKAQELLERLQRSNAEARVVKSISDLLAILPDDIASLRPGLLRSRAHSVVADAHAFADNEAELFPDAISQLTDLSETLSDLQACFPSLRDIEAEALALDLAGAKATEAKRLLDEIVGEILNSDDIATADADSAIETMREIASEDAAPRVQERRTAEFALVVQNIMRTVLSSGLQYTKELSGAVRKGSITGTEKGAEATFKAGFICLAVKVVGPLAGLAVFASLFTPLAKTAKKIEEEAPPLADDQLDI